MDGLCQRLGLYLLLWAQPRGHTWEIEGDSVTGGRCPLACDWYQLFRWMTGQQTVSSLWEFR